MVESSSLKSIAEENTTTMSDQTPDSPLSLQDQCFVQLISNLESFTCESLALLPLRLRHKLLVNLPAVDICKLESTPVPKGLNMSSNVWEAVCTQRCSASLIQTVKKIESPSSSRSCDWKEIFFLSCTTSILNNSTDLTTHPLGSRMYAEKCLLTLFSIPNCLGVKKWCGFKHPFIQVAKDDSCIPCRYSWITTENHCRADIQLLQILMDECAFFPRCLYIKCDYFCCADLWYRRSIAIMPLLQKFLSRVEAIEIISEDDEDPLVATFFFDTILSEVNTVLHSVSLSGNSHFIATTLQECRSYFAVEDGVHSVQNVLKHTIQNIPYGNLQFLSIHVTYDYELNGISDLIALLEHQVLLKEFKLDCCASDNNPDGGVAFDKMLMAAAHLFDQPHFYKLQLEVMGISLLVAKAIIDAFLSAASSSEQVLVLDNMAIDDDSSDRITPYVPTLSLKMAENGYEHKKLVLANIGNLADDENIDNLFHWVTSYPNLSLQHLLVPQYLEPGTCFVQLISKNVNMKIKELCVHHQTIPHLPTLPQDFEKLFSNLCLSKLELEDCNIGPGGHLPALTQGLCKQCSTQSIKTLSLSSNSLGKCLDWELQEFFDVIFSLPEVKNVQLSLKNNRLTCQHLELLYRSWKYSLRKKQLKILHIGGNELPDPESELMEKIMKISVHTTCM